jgi:hypothetical protein
MAAPRKPRGFSRYLMDDLIARICKTTGLDPATAQKAVGIILAFLQREGPPAEIGKLFEAIPQAQDFANLGAETTHSGFGATLGSLIGQVGGGGGLMELAGELSNAGVSMGQMQTLGKEVFAFGREKIGEDAMGAIAGAIPGLGQFV